MSDETTSFKSTETLDEFSTVNYRELIAESHDEPMQEMVVREGDVPTIEDENEDFEIARNNIKQIIKKGQDVLDDMISLAKASDHPRAFEVTGTLIKTLVDANKDLMDLHKRKKELRGKPTPDKSGVTNVTHNVQNNSTVFVGTSKDLLDALSENEPGL